MADRYAILPAGTTSLWSQTSTWSATSGGATGASVPTSADNVFVDANSVAGTGAVLSVDVTSYCNNMDWTGVTNNPVLEFTQGHYLRCYGNVTLSANQTLRVAAGYSWGDLAFNGNANKTLTTNGVYIPAALYMADGTGVITLADNLSCLYICARNGTLNTNGKTVTTTINGIVDFGYSGTKSFILGASVLNIQSWVFTGAFPTVNAGTSEIICSGNFTGGGETYNNINLNGTAHTVSGSFTCATLTRNGTANKTDTLTMTSGTTLTCTTFAMIGNSATNRLLVQSSTLGTAATITATNWTGTVNVDIMDITATNAVDLSAIAGLSGDCGGNTGITFTTAAAQTSAGAGNWSGAIWGAGRVPLPQDDVSCSHNVTVDMPRIGKSITFTGTPTITGSITSNISIYGSLTISSGTTWDAGIGWTYFRGRGNYTLTSNGKDLYSPTFYMVGGTITLQDNLFISTGIRHYNGTLDFNNKNVTASALYSYPSATRSLLLGSGTITLTRLSVGTKWDFTTTTGLTFNAGTSTIILTNSSANAEQFDGGSLTYNNVTVSGAGAFALTITGNNTFNTFTVDRSQAAKTIVATGTTQTVSAFVCPTAGRTLCTITGGTWVKTGGNRVVLDCMSISGSTVLPAWNWYAGRNSTNGLTNTNWIFRGLPSSNGANIPVIRSVATPIGKFKRGR